MEKEGLENYISLCSQFYAAYNFTKANNLAADALLIKPDEPYCISILAFSQIAINGAEEAIISSSADYLEHAIDITNTSIVDGICKGKDAAREAFRLGTIFYENLSKDIQLVCDYMSKQLSAALMDFHMQKISNPILDGKALFGKITSNERIVWNQMTEHNTEVNQMIAHYQANVRLLNSFKEVMLGDVTKNLSTLQELTKNF